MPTNPPLADSFQKIKRFVVLMLENRSFDHLLGYMKKDDPRIDGVTGEEFNFKDPNSPTDDKIKVGRASSFVMTFDPGHEFYDVQIQLYGILKNTDPTLPPIANPPVDPAPMTGFVNSASKAVDFAGDERLVMECFQPDQLPVLSTLAKEFALLNYWYSSLPGPTWPNRFFIHAATSGGLTDSPTTAQILEGFSFRNGTVYDRLEKAGKSWCIYHDGLPQTVGIVSLRDEYINPLTEHFQDMEEFAKDVKKGDLADYTFIEPDYDTGNNFIGGNSMHPLNDIRKGEQLVKHVYETLRNSPYWQDTMLIITFDEHGGFYDHQAPPATVPTGDDEQYSHPSYSFDFARLGVRVPGIVISAYTQQATVIGLDPKDASVRFDHSSVLATVEKRFAMPSLTKRDQGANTLDVAINLPVPRLLPTEAPTTLPVIPPDSAVVGVVAAAEIAAAAGTAPLSANQTTMLALALSCELKITPPDYHSALISNHQKIVDQQDAAEYIRKVEDKIADKRTDAANANTPRQA
jgi:phospholipase C